ncbi:MAG: hypothetical protein NT113_06230 [Hyphomicrobiales bacterium]|nr:hypothetical protein [Hyphomicrobiales bacterium]
MDTEVKAMFKDRQAAELALEHLVQEIGIERTGIFIAAHGDGNTSGTHRSGADARSSLDESRGDTDPKLSGEIEMSVACGKEDTERVTKALKEVGARLSS